MKQRFGSPWRHSWVSWLWGGVPCSLFVVRVPIFLLKSRFANGEATISLNNLLKEWGGSLATVCLTSETIGWIFLYTWSDCRYLEGHGNDRIQSSPRKRGRRSRLGFSACLTTRRKFNWFLNALRRSELFDDDNNNSEDRIAPSSAGFTLTDCCSWVFIYLGTNWKGFDCSWVWLH